MIDGRRQTARLQRPKENRTLSTKETRLEQRLKLLVSQGGGDLFGMADLNSAREFITAQGGESLNRFPRAISLGMRLSDAIVNQHDPNEKNEDSLYRHHVYRVVTPALDFLAQRIYGELQAEGYEAFPVPASLPYDTEKLRGVFSHKLAAHLSGLGWIGKSCLLITPEFGPRVRFVTVLTDAPLSPGIPLNRKCGRCQACIVACPTKAFSGTEFRPEDPVETRFNTRACFEYRRTHPCGTCVAECPVGQSKESR